MDDSNKSSFGTYVPQKLRLIQPITIMVKDQFYSFDSIEVIAGIYDQSYVIIKAKANRTGYSISHLKNMTKNGGTSC